MVGVLEMGPLISPRNLTNSSPKLHTLRATNNFTREIRIAQRDDLRARRISAWQRRGLGLIKHTVGYGYQSWRAILWPAGVLAIVTFVNMLFV